MILTSALSMAPLRISFVGGGTDFKSFYSKKEGKVIAAAISKYVYVHVKRHDPLFQEKFRISYSTTESCASRDDIKNKIVKNTLEFLDFDEPIQISISSDLPSNSGLGSSSSFTVALLLAIHSLKNENVSPAQLAEEACEIEINMLASPIGKQDQYAAAFGGINCYYFKPNDLVLIEPIRMANSNLLKLYEGLNLTWTMINRESNTILGDQEMRSEDNYLNLLEILSLVDSFKVEISRPVIDLYEIAQIIDKGWQIKKKLSPLIASKEINSMVDSLISDGALGAKLLGAGGGGFILTINDSKEFQKKIATTSSFTPSFDFRGARLVALN